MGKLLKIEDAQICYKNFSGAESRYNKKGRKNFNLILDEETAERLREDGWNIKEDQPREEGDDVRYRTAINVNFDCQYPPLVIMYDEEAMRPIELDEVTVARLDNLKIVKCDLVISGRVWDNGKVKGYLREGRFIIRDDSGFSSKYRQYDNAEELYDR